MNRSSSPMFKFALTAATATLMGVLAAQADTDIKDIDYNGEITFANNKDKLDLYIPTIAESAPVIMFIHGGGLMAGNKDQAAHVGKRFAQEGFLTACINYRLSPNVTHPAHIEDAATAFAWLHANVAEHGGDPDRIFVIGHSAGAYLAGLLATDGRYLKAHDLKTTDIHGTVPISGFFHVGRIAPDRSKSIWGEDEDTWTQASPAHYANNKISPILFLYAERDTDPRKLESQEFSAALSANGAQTSYREIADRTHVTVFMRMNESTDDAVAQILAFIASILEPQHPK